MEAQQVCVASSLLSPSALNPALKKLSHFPTLNMLDEDPSEVLVQ